MIPDAAKLVILMLGLGALVYVVVAPAPPPYEAHVFRELRALDGQLVADELPDGLADAEFQTLSGETLRLSDLQRGAENDPDGKIVFLNLWATWCRPCREEIPSMAALAEKLAPENRDFAMVALSWDDSPDGVSTYLRSHPKLLRHAVVAMDPGGERSRALGTRLLPETYVIDRDGRVVARFQSIREWSSPESVRLFTGLIRQR